MISQCAVGSLAEPVAGDTGNDMLKATGTGLLVPAPAVEVQADKTRMEKATIRSEEGKRKHGTSITVPS